MALSHALLCLLAASCIPASAAELAAHYPLDGGPNASDASGNGHHGVLAGDCAWIEGPFGAALDLSGASGYVDCGTIPELDPRDGISLAIWCHPRTRRGGLINWSTGGGWVDERLVLAVNTWEGQDQFMACLANGTEVQQLRPLWPLEPGRWTHVTLTLDGRSVRIYRDGLPFLSASQSVRPDIEGVPLRLGFCEGLGHSFFDGLLDEARVYSGALSPDEVFALYRSQAETHGVDASQFRRPEIIVDAYPDAGSILIAADARRMRPLPEGASLSAQIIPAPGREPLVTRKGIPVPASGPAEIVLSAGDLPPGDYLARVSLHDGNGATVGDPEQTALTWTAQPEAFRGVRILNNLAWELLTLKDPVPVGPRDYSFRQPMKRWGFFRANAEIADGARASLFLDGEPDPVLTLDQPGESTAEAMRFLPAGEHSLRIETTGQAKVHSLVVRSVPMLQHAFYGANPHIHPYGPYDWRFLAKDILPNVNTMIGNPGPEMDGWVASGRQWISIIGLPKLKGTSEADVQAAFDHWSSAVGFQNEKLSGVIVDEFGGGDAEVYDVYRKAVERIYADPRFRGKSLSPYGGTFHGDDRSSRFARVCVDGGGYMAWEVYLPEQPDEAAARQLIARRITDEMPLWRKRFPDAPGNMCLVLGYMSQPTESLNIDPQVDFKVYMDMQVNALANHPSCFGLGGIQEYHSSYADEESVRWAGRLYRHYCIGGNREPLTDDPYVLPHLVNADFDRGTEGWEIQAAAEDSVRTAEHSGYSWLQGRYPPTGKGNTFLITRRSSEKPNRFSQTIRALQPGRLYSLKMITADYQDLVNERSVKAPHAVSIAIEGVEQLDGPRDSFQFTFPNCYAHHVGKFDDKYSYWMNYHWRVFRATATQARLTVSDWASDQDPGGPEDQELMFNFIEVQPYLER